MLNHNIDMPDNVAFIINTLENSGYEAFAVGGCVRDAIMGRTPNDWDITTSAKPEEVKALFHRTIDTGIQHGTVTVMIKKEGYEITTYRIDGEYTDGRHPKDVIFTSNLIEDLKRRDFTINAMAYNHRAGIVDAFNGIDDLSNKIIRCVGNATERFTEDALRILRALRFSAQLNFTICEDTCNAIKKLAPNLIKISKERIQCELDKLITSPYSNRFLLVRLYGLNKYIFESDSKLYTDDANLYKSICSIMSFLPDNHYLRWAAATYYEEKPETIFRKLKFDNKTINICSKLVNAAHTLIPTDKPSLKRMIVAFGEDIFANYLFTFLYGLSNAGLYEAGSLSDIDNLKKMYNEIISDNDCISLKSLAITGSMLISEGFEPGKSLGSILDYLFNCVLDNPSLNTYDTLLSMAKDYSNSL